LLSRITFRWRWALGVAAIAGFVLVTRAEPSVLRAALMAVLALTAMSIGRAISGVRLLSIAVSVLLVVDPMLVHSVGFRLSVAATAGLVLFARPMRRWLPGPDWLATPLAVTLAAQVGAVPVMVATFGPVSLMAVPANLLAEPAAGLVMTSGLTAGLAAGVVREEVAWLIQAPTRVAVWWVDSVASATAGLSVRPLGLVGWGIVLGGCGSAALLWRQRGRVAVGRVAALAVLPAALVLRPPSVSADTEPVALAAGELRACGPDWVVVVDERIDPRMTARVTESLWKLGLARVSVVSTASETPSARELAHGLHAHLLPDAPPRCPG
jgi:competence protein ComEC